jgi:hypothetical protein
MIPIADPHIPNEAADELTGKSVAVSERFRSRSQLKGCLYK